MMDGPCPPLWRRRCGVSLSRFFGDGSQTRSFCYVDDLVEGIYRLLMSDHHLPVNIGNPEEITILEFAREIKALIGSEVEIAFRDLPQDDPKVRRPDISRAREWLNWEPKINRTEGLKITLDYFKNKMNITS